jgi:predicted Zn finger-like uncharacterized protein
MILVCSQCASRLQLEDAKVPARPFTVRCPKCQSIIQGQPAASANEQQSGLTVGETPSLDNPRFTPAVAAPAFKANQAAAEIEEKSSHSAKEPNDLARLLAELLQQGAPAGTKQENAARLKWENRRALICVAPARREPIARALVDSDYQAYIAEDTSQAIERMREAQMDVVILESDFDQIEQGAAFVTSEINALHPAKRRRLMFVQLSPTARTLDTHAAFVNNVNLVVNVGDVDHLPQALERAIRDFNDLYRDFNTAHNIASI